MHFLQKKSQKIVLGTLTGLVDRKHSSNMQNYEYAMIKFLENLRKHFFAKKIILSKMSKTNKKVYVQNYKFICSLLN